MSYETKPDDEVRRQMFDKYRDEQLVRERYNADKYDNTILVYSTGALALSLSFIKEVVPLSSAHALWILKTSWICMVCAVLLMLVSFPIGQAANRKSVDDAEDYYLRKIDDAFNRRSWQGVSLKWFNVLAGAAFFFGIVLTTSFVWINVQENPTVTDKKAPLTGIPANDAMPSSLMQRVPLGEMNKAMESAKMTAVPAPTPAPAPASSVQPPTPLKPNG